MGKVFELSKGNQATVLKHLNETSVLPLLSIQHAVWKDADISYRYYEVISNHQINPFESDADALSLIL